VVGDVVRGFGGAHAGEGESHRDSLVQGGDTFPG